MLDAVIDYLPPPLDIPAVRGSQARHDEEERNEVREASEKEPFAALAQDCSSPLLRQADLHPCLLRASWKRASQVLNSTKGRRSASARSSRYLTRKNPVEEAHAVLHYAVIGLKDTTTGDTLCVIDKPVVLNR